MEDRCAPQDRVKSSARKEALEGVGAALGKICTKAVASDVFHALLVGERRYSASRVVFAECFGQEDEVGKAAADGRNGLLEGREGRLVGR